MRRLTLATLALAACTSAQQPGAPAASGRANLTAVQPTAFTMEGLGRFDAPFAMAFLPDGSLLVTEKAGTLKLRMADGRIGVVSGVPRVSVGGQGGLLDVAPAPDFAISRRIYLTYSQPGAGAGELALARASLDWVSTVQCRKAPCSQAGIGSGSLSDVQVLWRSGSDGPGGQFGATIAFAPDGRSLFLASGERQRFTPAQDPDQALGKIVHLTLDGKPWPGNPGAGKIGADTIGVIDPPADTAAAASAPVRRVPARTPNTTPAETWSTGHRNPYGLAFDGGGRLWEVEMGPKGGDELNLIQAGGNYGWPRASNGSNYDGLDIPDHRSGDGFEAPKLWWNPSISPGGMMIYSGALFPGWTGDLFLCALSGQGLIRIALSGESARAVEQWDLGTRIRDVAQAPDGSIWLLEDGGRGAGGRLMRLAPRR